MAGRPQKRGGDVRRVVFRPYNCARFVNIDSRCVRFSIDAVPELPEPGDGSSVRVPSHRKAAIIKPKKLIIGCPTDSGACIVDRGGITQPFCGVFVRLVDQGGRVGRPGPSE